MLGTAHLVEALISSPNSFRSTTPAPFLPWPCASQFHQRVCEFQVEYILILFPIVAFQMFSLSQGKRHFLIKAGRQPMPSR
uniref:Uncharacterized protein n=1 Tax=Utricularia reniformis TaxID=192314 RepID=A0A1Y0B079_9LAMI|nr:hypothetical protein AEK19_MT0590 [Utricularia reniformis]ART30846.1 hypothetical protein AEK19_MT0590 [Utricularia reniformis]